MSNELIAAPSVARNNVSKTLSQMVFGKKSPNAGKVFFAPIVDVSVQDDVTWTGIDSINGMVNKALRLIFADLYVDNLDEKTGEFNQANWEAEAADFTAGVAKLSDLEEQLDNLQAEQQKYALDDQFGATDDQGVETARSAELKSLITQTALRIKPLRAQKAAIEAKYADRAAKRKAKEAASPTATAPVAA